MTRINSTTNRRISLPSLCNRLQPWLDAEDSPNLKIWFDCLRQYQRFSHRLIAPEAKLRTQIFEKKYDLIERPECRFDKLVVASFLPTKKLMKLQPRLLLNTLFVWPQVTNAFTGNAKNLTVSHASVQSNQDNRLEPFAAIELFKKPLLATCNGSISTSIAV
jgi:hypothetical protein